MLKKVVFIINIIIIFLSGCGNIENQDEIPSEKESVILSDGMGFNSDGTVTLADGCFAFGLQNPETKEILNKGERLLINESGTDAVISLEQNVSQRVEYLLIIMVDYIQQDFFVNGELYRAYPFSLEGYDGIDIEVDLSNGTKGRELEYFFVVLPNEKDLSIDSAEGWDLMFKTQTMFEGRFLLQGDDWKEEEVVFDEGYTVADKGISNICTLTQNEKKLTAMPFCHGGERVKLALGTEAEEDETCAIVAFLNWEQVPIQGDMNKMVKLEHDKIFFYDLTMPEVEEPTPYQVFVFMKPFDTDAMYWSSSYASLRTIIQI